MDINENITINLQYSDGYIHLLDELSNEMKYEIVALGNSRDNFTPTKDYVNPKKYTSSEVISGNAINCVLAIKMNSIPMEFGIVRITNQFFLPHMQEY